MLATLERGVIRRSDRLELRVTAPSALVHLWGSARRGLWLIALASSVVLALDGSRLPAFGPQEPAKESSPRQRDVTELDIDELLAVHVISPAKRDQVVAKVAAAIHVVRHDDVKRVGATSLPEALRLVPGMQVARTNAHTWAVSARGFNDNLSNKLLVLIDGRSVYSPLHSGVFWDVQDVAFEDLERIEVVRGPGGSLWGSNAINGVVNVISKTADETQGAVITATAGTEDRVASQVRYGFELAEDVHARVYGKFLRRDDAANGVNPEIDAYDGYDMSRGGFRLDGRIGQRERLTIIGDTYEGRVRDRSNAPSLLSPVGFDSVNGTTEVAGGSILGRWERKLAPDASVQVQAYYDHTSRSSTLFGDVCDTLDLDIQHQCEPANGHVATWGAGYRVYSVDFRSSFAFQVSPEERTDAVASAFLQDEVRVSDKIGLTLGCKVEHNDYSEWEFQPSGRIGWQVDDAQFVWAAVARAVRTPSIVDVDARLTPIVVPGAIPLAFTIVGDSRFRSEELVAYEVGYRVRPASEVWADIACFYNDYSHLRSGTPGVPTIESSPVLHVVQPIELGNDLNGKSYGGELSLNVQAAPWWLLQGAYSYLHVDLSEASGEGRDPRHTAHLRSSMQLIGDISIDATTRYVSALDAFGVDEYVEVTARLGWQNEARTFEASIVGHDLVHQEHAEFDNRAARSEIERGLSCVLCWRF